MAGIVSGMDKALKEMDVEKASLDGMLATNDGRGGMDDSPDLISPQPLSIDIVSLPRLARALDSWPRSWTSSRSSSRTLTSGAGFDQPQHMV